MADIALTRKGLAAPLAQISLVGQDEILTNLFIQVSDGRVAHAYLFSGPRGIGKFGIAHTLASALLCDNPDPISGMCGSCPQCSLSRGLQHPDLHVIFPLPKKKSGDEEEEEIVERVSDAIHRQLIKLAADPYGETLIDGGKSKDENGRPSRSEAAIRVGYVRWLIRTANRKPFQAQRKVFVICHADRMNNEAQSSFLKTLEAPPVQTHFVLLTERESEIKDTVRSRCRRIRIPAIPLSSLTTWLESTGTSGSQARAAATLSRGSVARARDLISQDIQKSQTNIVGFFRTIATGCDPRELQKYAGLLIDSPEAERERIIELMISFWYDVALLRSHGGATPTALGFGEFRDILDKLLVSFPGANAERAIAEIETAAGLLEKNYSAEFIFYSLAIRLQDAFGARSRGRGGT